MARRYAVFYDGKVHVQRTMCSTCIGHPDNRMDLHPDRVPGMLADVERDQSCIPCHQTLDDRHQAVCRWQFDVCKTQPLQIAERLGHIEWMNPTTKKPINGGDT